MLTLREAVILNDLCYAVPGYLQYFQEGQQDKDCSGQEDLLVWGLE